MFAQLQRVARKWRYESSGFTIVELLIVVVIIGILAAIVIVAYNGVTAQAENNKTKQAVAQYIKGLQMYAVQNGRYPIEDGYPCLGPHPGTSCGKVGAAADLCLGSGSTSSQADFDAAMKTMLGNNLPTLSTQVLSCGTVSASGGYYTPNETPSPAGSTARIIFFLKGNQPCDGIGGVQSYLKSQTDDATKCTLTLPTV